MSNKLLLSDIVDALSESAKISKKDASTFLKGLFELVEEQLLTDKIVKIKGLGTFKLIRVESRRIANVNTGEIQEIAGHYKTTFTPDAALAEAVNEPFSHLETIILDEESVTDKPLESSIPHPQIVESQSEHEVIEHEPSVEIPEPEQPVINPQPEPSTEIAPTPQSEKKSGKNGYYWLAIIGVLFILTAGYYYYTINQPVKKAPVIASQKTVAPVKKDSLPTKTDDTNTEVTTTPPDTILCTERLEAGARLTRISLKYYGHKVFWVYLYQANKYVIENPNKVAAGTVIDIPNPKIFGIDANNPESVAKAKTLEAEILSKVN